MRFSRSHTNVAKLKIRTKNRAKKMEKKGMIKNQRHQKRLGDAFATVDSERTKWTFGAKSLQMDLTLRDCGLCLTGLREETSRSASLARDVMTDGW